MIVDKFFMYFKLLNHLEHEITFSEEFHDYLNKSSIPQN